MTIKGALVNGNQRIGLAGAPTDQLPWLKSLGCWTEIIQDRTRLFVPLRNAVTLLASELKAS